MKDLIARLRYGWGTKPEFHRMCREAADALEAQLLIYKQISSELVEAQAEIDALKSDLETERMRLAACGVVALADTPESAASARQMKDEYRSASCDDVARRVDECMRLRAEIEALEAVASGDNVLLSEQASLLRQCRAALDSLLATKPALGAIEYQCGALRDSLGNLRATLYEYRPQGVFGTTDEARRK